jgi:hypothetical protein
MGFTPSGDMQKVYGFPSINPGNASLSNLKIISP